MSSVNDRRRRMLISSGIAAASLALPQIAAQAAETEKGAKQMSSAKPSIVFAHGIWADGSSFSKLIPMLQAEGHEVLCSQHGLDTLRGDVDCLLRAVRRAGSPVILVGHSYGGTLITAAGVDPRVVGLVYIAALAPDADETSQSQQAQFPVTDVFSHVDVADGRVWMRPSGIATFAGDLPEKEQKIVWATHAAPAADLFTQKIEGTAWRSKPSWYIVSKKDRTVQPELQRFVAKRMGAKAYEVDASHVSMLSHPAEVAKVIIEAAKTASAKVADAPSKGRLPGSRA